jgi:hypothetical protein
MAQQSLGNRWVDLNGKEKEFVAVFTDFLENSYMNTLGSYRGEKVVYDRDRIDGESAEVDIRLAGGEGTPIKIGYKLHLRSGQWMVYDAVIAIFVGGWALPQLWLFWVAPIIGAILAGWTYLWLGEEDPSRRVPVVGDRPPS